MDGGGVPAVHAWRTEVRLCRDEGKAKLHNVALWRFYSDNNSYGRSVCRKVTKIVFA